MRLKGQLARILVVGGLAVMTTGIASAGGCCIGCEWCGSPAPKVAHAIAAQTGGTPHTGVTAQPSLFSSFLRFVLALI